MNAVIYTVMQQDRENNVAHSPFTAFAVFHGDKAERQNIPRYDYTKLSLNPSLCVNSCLAHEKRLHRTHVPP